MEFVNSRLVSEDKSISGLNQTVQNDREACSVSLALWVELKLFLKLEVLATFTKVCRLRHWEGS